MLVPLGLGLLQFRDPATDTPVRNGVVYAIDPTTGERAQVWADQQGTIEHTDGEINLNSNGEAYVFGNQIYTLQLYDCCSRLISTFSPVGFYPILQPGYDTLEIDGGASIVLTPALLTGGTLFNFMNILVIINDGGTKNDVVIELGDEFMAAIAEGAEINFIRYNAVGNGLGDSGFTIIEGGSTEIYKNQNYVPECGVGQSTNTACHVVKMSDTELFLSGDLGELAMAALGNEWRLQGNTIGSTMFTWLRLNEASGTNAADSSGNGNNGTASDGAILGGPAIAAPEYAATFPDADDDIAITGLNLTEAGRSIFATLTWEAATQVLFVEGDIVEPGTTEPGGIPKGYELEWWYKDSNEFGVVVYAYDSDISGFQRMEFNAYDAFTDLGLAGTMYTVAVSINGTAAGSIVQVWINGVSLGTQTLDGTLENSALDRLIGRSYSGTVSDFDGEMNDFMVFDGPCNTTDAERYYNAVINEAP